jgi:hypothetical protein
LSKYIENSKIRLYHEEKPERGIANMADVNRNIYYYDLVLKIFETASEGKRKKKKTAENQGEKLKEIFTKIKNKQDRLGDEKDPVQQQALQKSLEMSLSNQSKLYVIVDEISKDGMIKFRIVLCRSNAFPFVYKGGKLELLTENVSGNFELAEITHCVIFTDSMIMGGEFNFHGARPSAIAAYISYKDSDVAFLECNGKLNNDSVDKIVEGKDLSLFELSIRNTEDIKARLAANNFIISTWLQGVPEDVGEYRIVLKKTRGSKHSGFVSPLTLDEYRKLLGDFREDISNLKISQGIQRDAIDLLKDKLVHTLPIDIKTMNKYIVSEYMYNEIVNFYHDVVKEY